MGWFLVTYGAFFLIVYAMLGDIFGLFGSIVASIVVLGVLILFS